MANMLHMNADLVGTACLKFTLYQADITESFKDFVVRGGLLSLFSIRVSIEYLPKSFMPSNMCFDRSGLFFKVTPNQGHILTLYRMIEKLFGQTRQGFFIFCQNQQPACVFINSVYKPESGQITGWNFR